mmetsp:Transcript_85486/g.250239  ORF Transcript_85486/g.250239 Transcript_85486/m.250239 type:complete len:206 (+) Transcript_85486:623-1240(+)
MVVFALRAFSSFRMAVAFATSASSSATSPESAVASFCSWATAASRPSISARRASTSWLLDLRVCSLVASSVSHQPLCSVSCVACVMSRSRSSSMSFLTLPKGSSCARTAMVESTWLSSLADSARRNSAALRRLGPPSPVECSCASMAGRPPCWRRSWAREGRCFCAAPETSSVLRISMACCRVDSSSVRSCWRASYSPFFCAHVA